jgi:hypothetical protein
MRAIRQILSCLLFCTLAYGCGRKEQALAPAPPRPQQAAQTDPQTAEFFPLAQLSPDRPTHLATDSLGDVYWIQESPSGQDTLFVAGQNDIPQPTALTTSAILAACALRASTAPAISPGINGGNIQSIAIDSDDHVLFFFSGGMGRSTCVCLGQFNPRDQSIHILDGTESLAGQSGMGGSIALAQGQILTSVATRAARPSRRWLWLHHSDAALLMRFDPAMEGNNPIEFSRSFSKFSADGAEQDLKDDQLAFSADDGNSLLMMNWRTACLCRLDEYMVATKWVSVLGLPRNLSALTARPGNIAIAFAPVGEPAAGTDGDGQSVKDAHLLKVQYPALIAFTDNGCVSIAARDDLHGPPELDIGKMRLQQFLPTSNPHEWIGYDAESGMVVRVRLSPQ